MKNNQRKTNNIIAFLCLASLTYFLLSQQNGKGKWFQMTKGQNAGMDDKTVFVLRLE